MPQPQRNPLQVISLKLVMLPLIWLQSLTPHNLSSQHTLGTIIAHPPLPHHQCFSTLAHQQPSVENINDYSQSMRLQSASSTRLNGSSCTPLDANELTPSTIMSTSVSYVEPVRLRDHACSPHYNCVSHPHTHKVQGKTPSQYRS